MSASVVPSVDMSLSIQLRDRAIAVSNTVRVWSSIVRVFEGVHAMPFRGRRYGANGTLTTGTASSDSGSSDNLIVMRLRATITLRDLVLVEEFDELGEVGQRSGQTVDL